NWLLVDLEGTGALTDAIGAVVTAAIGDVVQTRIVRSGASYLSQNDMRLHFGLGASSAVDRLEVRWPDGSVSERLDVAANQILVVKQE
ncbi:MAG: ASPIC/UnbV domain-containing protein, partial [Thermoanaerobaculia bacterium]|nr:ASPIC/UnbV domain-containing protein [Thermoanaerobaculia bacterium]